MASVHGHPWMLLERGQAKVIFLPNEIDQRQIALFPTPRRGQRSTGKIGPIPASRETTDSSDLEADIESGADGRRDWMRYEGEMRARFQDTHQLASQRLVCGAQRSAWRFHLMFGGTNWNCNRNAQAGSGHRGRSCETNRN
jgi:hypothetical protein